jgi:hypothetical protein
MTKYRKRVFTEEHKLHLSQSKQGKPSLRKGKTNIELYGKEKADEISKKISESRLKGLEEGHIAIWNKGKTGLQISTRKGKRNIEIYGEEKAKEITEKLSKSHLGKSTGENNPMSKPEVKEKHKANVRIQKLKAFLEG